MARPSERARGHSPFGCSSSSSNRFLSIYSKTKYSFPLRLNASLSCTMFGALAAVSSLSIFTSRIVVLRTISSSADEDRSACDRRADCLSPSLSLNFLIATISRVSLLRHLSTTPYAPGNQARGSALGLHARRKPHSPSPMTPMTPYLFIAQQPGRRGLRRGGLPRSLGRGRDHGADRQGVGRPAESYTMVS